MLILRRRTGEAIVVGGQVEIEIIEVTPTRVKLGVHAPKDVLVERREVLRAARENRSAVELLKQEGLAGLASLITPDTAKACEQSADTK